MTNQEAIKELTSYLSANKHLMGAVLSDECAAKSIKALEQEPYEKFESTKDHIYKLAGDYKCWDNRLTEDEAVELYHILEQEPKTGHWNIIGHNCVKCNQCGFERDYYNQSNYCPNCGARMVEAKGEE